LYCSLPGFTLPAKQSQVDAFLQALDTDMTNAAASIQKHGLTVMSVYVGGGTPTSFSEADFARLLTSIKQTFINEHTKEFTVEAGRPDSISAGKIAAMRSAGVNRVSVNPQTMQQKTLDRIGRNHTVDDIVTVFHQFRQANIGIINMDVIAGLPGETEQDMIDTMEKIASLEPDNLTIHTLALKKGSRLKTSLSEHSLPNETVTGRMVEIAAAYARQLGMQPYYLYRQKYMTGNLENVGYSFPGKECLYNMQIMEERQTVIGVGPAAGTKAVNCRTFDLRKCYNAKDVTAYMNNLPIYLGDRQLLLDNLFAAGKEEISTC
ncbi:coproporphyrinogen dehydrogenase HemZ, partial [Anaerospora hongkongensis]|uniref:coproporphyrinogen dehydrogenase HemZ n=1 Tax=Anaerospora hongkongensis TaxID=244830 RepID=UPI002FD8F6EB